MTKSLAARLAIPVALLAGVAQGITWLNIPDVDAYYPLGTEFVLQWVPEDRTDTFKISLDSFLTHGIYIGPGSGWIPIPQYDYKSEQVLETDVKYSDGNFTWPIEPFDGRSGEEWWYRWTAYPSQYESDSPRGFHIGPQPS